jgi:diaminohydroxyphosphoribosylaminopyrimidine deaminase/5-amino-6-(5-phosphoribosylamino)uracil reductase
VSGQLLPRTARRIDGSFSEADNRHMEEALALAERGRGTTRPNPVVGAVVVKHGRVLARGYHRRAGGAHAEVDALASLGPRAAGATLYVTLEPCCHTGRTGPCTREIIRAGIARVVVGCRDLNPRVDGRGITRLRRAGIRVDVGCLEARSHAQNRAFFRWIRDQRPWITLKVASTLDGFIASRDSGARWITGLPARTVAHELRATHDAVMVGAGTVLADDPQLTVRLGQPPRRGQPLRVVLDGRLRTPPTARLLRADPANPPLLIGAAGDAATARRGRLLTRAGAEVLLLAASSGGRVALATVLQALAQRGVQSLLVEGGSRVLGAFVSERAADAVAWFLAPKLAGSGVPVVDGPGLDWRSLLVLTPPAVRAVGQDLLITADVVSNGRRKRRAE